MHHAILLPNSLYLIKKIYSFAIDCHYIDYPGCVIAEQMHNRILSLDQLLAE